MFLETQLRVRSKSSFYQNLQAFLNGNEIKKNDFLQQTQCIIKQVINKSMKTSKFLFVAAFAASLVGCQDDTFVSNNVNGNDGLKGKLVKSGLLGVGYGTGNAETRAYSVDGRFIWMPTALTATGEIDLDPITGVRSNQRIGFCWTGMNTVNPEYSAATALSQKVYTNYEFEHVGWLDKDAVGVEREECAPYALTNGGYIVGETVNGDVAKWQSNPYTSLNGTGTNYQTNDNGKYALGEYSNGELNLGSGLFKTENSDVFEGEYLVYFPYNDGFTRGQILAVQPDHFDIDVNQNRFTTLSRYAFSIGHVNHYAGGQSLEKISTKTLSSFAGVKLYDSSATSSTNNIKKVIFYANETGFLFEQDLDAQACVDAIINNKPLGKDVYYNRGTTAAKTNDTNAIYATLTNDATEYATVSNSTNGSVNDALRIYFPVLPQEVNDLTVVLINDEDKTYTYQVGAANFESGKDNSIAIDLKDATFENKYMVVDEETLFSALENIKDNGSTDNTIQLLRSVRIENVLSHQPYAGNLGTIFFNKNIEIMTNCKPNAKGEKVGISLASGQEMYIKSMDGTGEAKLIFKVPFTVEGAGCCDADVARLSVGSTAAGVANIEFTEVINHGALALANVAGKAATVKIDKLVNEYDEWALDKAKTLDAAQLFLLGNTQSDILIETLTNKGTITASPVTVGKPSCVVGQNWTSWKDYVDGAISTLKQNSFANRPVVATIETLTNEVSISAKNTALKEGGIINIEGFAEFVVNTLTNTSETAIIKTLNVVDGVANTTLDGRLTLTGASTNNGIIDNNGVTNLEGQPMQNNGLLIDQLSGQLGGQYIENGTGNGLSRTYGTMEYKTDLPVKGMYVSKVATNQRMNFTLTDEVTSASVNVIEIVGSDVSFFNLENVDPSNVLKDKDIYVAAGSKQIAFKAFNSQNEATAKSFGHCVTVRGSSVLNVKDGLLSTVNDVNIEKDAEFRVDAKNTADKSEITIGGNLNNAGITTHKADILTVNEDLNNVDESTFTSNKQFAVKGNVVTAGEFDSNGTPNAVTGNFVQTAGKVTFAYKTTTTVDGQFSCATSASFLREALGTSGDYRATVNVGSLGELKGNNNGGGWPTVKRN